MRKFLCALNGAVLFFATAPAQAELVSAMTANVVATQPDGSEILKPADRAKPGEVVEYTLTHTNAFAHAIGGVAVVGPIPSGTEFMGAMMGRSATTELEVRGDFDPDIPGEEWAVMPAMRKIRGEDGVLRSEPAKASDFSALRWTLASPLNAGAAVNHVYRVRVK